MQKVSSHRPSERGAVLIMVAISIIALLAFSAFVVDYGVMWVSRSQVQTAADAAALSGAVALAFDNPSDFAGAKKKAQFTGKANGVWGAAPEILLTDVIAPTPCPNTPGWGADNNCVRAQAFRNQTRNNPLPIFFGSLVGVSAQGVQATATARAVAANATNCLKPWAVADKWSEINAPPWTQSSTYDPTLGDIYTPPSATSPGTGFSNKDANGNPVDFGYQLVLKLNNPGNGALSAGWAMELDLPNIDANGSGAAYGENITGCTSATVGIAAPGEQCLTEDPTKGCIGVRTGAQAGDNHDSPNKPLGQLMATDPNATWTDSPSPGHIVSTQSPSGRVVPVAVFDIAKYLSQGYTGTNGIVKVVNILGFFVEGTCADNFFKEAYLNCPNGGSGGDEIVGRLVNYPGLNVPTGGTVTGAFGSIIVLVR
jgi:hypothetical protein